MRLGKRTAKIVREAIVLAHVEGARWAGHVDPDNYPKDSTVVRRVLAAASNMPDLYPHLSRLDEAQEADTEMREESVARIAALMHSLQATKESKA